MSQKGTAPVELKIKESSILFNRLFSHIDECPLCEGMRFNFLEKTVDLEELKDNHNILSALWMALADGESWEDIDADTKNTPINYSDWESYICISCGSKGDSPIRGGT